MKNGKWAPLALVATLNACSSGAALPTNAATSAVTQSQSQSQAQSQAEAQLRDAVGRLAEAWNAGNGNAWGAEFWPDGSLINILGVVFPNAMAVSAVTTKILAGPFAGSTFTPSVSRLRFLGNGAAVVDVDVSITNFRALPPGAIATSPGLLLTRLSLAFERRGGVWKIEAAQNTAVLPTPM